MKLLPFRSPALICDDQLLRRKELSQLKKAVDESLQLYHTLEELYRDKRKQYEECDRKRALIDGRLQVVKPKTGQKGGSGRQVKQTSSMAEQIARLPKDKLAELIALFEGTDEEDDD